MEIQIDEWMQSAIERMKQRRKQYIYNELEQQQIIETQGEKKRRT